MADVYADPDGPYRAVAQFRRVGTFGLHAFDVRQEAVETVDRGMPEFTFLTQMSGPASGETDYGDGWRRHDLVPGIVDVHPARTDVGFRISPIHLRGVAVDEDVLTDCLDVHGLAPDRLAAVTGQFRLLPAAAAQIDRLWRASEVLGGSGSLVVDAAFLSLLAELMRACSDDRLVAPPPATSDRRIARVLDHVEAHLDAALTVGELAALACVSPFHFGRVFRAATGETPHRYVMGRRLERAKEMLLAEPDLDVTSVALATGFASQSHLSAVFRARDGRAARRVAGAGDDDRARLPVLSADDARDRLRALRAGAPLGRHARAQPLRRAPGPDGDGRSAERRDRLRGGPK